MFRIGEFSKMSKTTIKTLRYYDQVGLLKPAFVDNGSGYRFYTTAQLLPLHYIISLRQAGLSIEDVQNILSGGNKQKILNARKIEIQKDIENAKEQISRIDMILKTERDDFMMNYQAVVKDLPECIVYYKDGVISTVNDYKDFVLQAGQECMKANPSIQCTVPEYSFIVYMDKEFVNTNTKIRFCEAVTAAGIETDTIKFKKIESVPAVCVYHRGAYENIREAFAFAHQWADENGYEPIECVRENYIDGVWNKEKVEDWLTEVQIPVKKRTIG